ncbi:MULTISPECIES: helix-turn-helix domain-containing protein [Akkermansia]|jgi:transcriptional regulator with XRE-family HTH domain|uniref:Helix-turn-helix transcriptional regulator n=1 Tax=Akkermansia massiliensis TaxID=2927224 RepID=A0ABT0R5G6_9BACT|nr:MULTISPECIES: helix-turn-helix transcriptional regulator [Akkermansia]DAJ63529.1 MAG TPA: Helix-turn-helix XRE-family like protein [Caudoviricetes sp.]MBT8782700.1 helix-turn-helix transcriptional regulator [Akkermansia muciniphila]MBT9594160.1 helix-turn-helix transcriptional regulator [Akkermansia muciniphila]MCL6656377.1 helix-turn-helix transcriptional regulator [Akkermansia massiliensis]PNC44124.1 hypothetical protein CXU08_04645 [Akkermansia muciniphila]
MNKQEENMQNSIFSLRLLEAMKSNGLTQKELADSAGITQAAVSRYLREENTPRASELGALAIALGVSMDWLWGRSGNKEEQHEHYHDLENWKVRAIKSEEKLKMLKSAMQGWLKKI